MSEFYVYAHIDRETDIPFYIGMGTGRRANSTERNYYWDLFVSKYSKNYEVRFIANNLSQEEALHIENHFIDKLGKVHNGSGFLINWTDGGYAEGVYVRIGLGEDENEITSRLTEYGKKLYSFDQSKYQNTKSTAFINEVINNRISEIRNKLLLEINTKANPRKPLILPFCISYKVNKRDQFKLVVSTSEVFLEMVNKPIVLNELPSIPYVDFFVHRIMIYFDLLIQESVRISVNEKIFSRSDPTWYFHKDYWHGYIKLLSCFHNRKDFSLRYIGPNKLNDKQNDIHNFEIEIVKL